MFIDPHAVDEALSFVARGPAAASIVFDYVLRSVVDSDRIAYGSAQTARYLARAGEPWRFGLNIADVEHFLSVRGFTTQLNLGPAELEERFPASR